MSQILAISDSIENTRYDVSRKVATFKAYGLDPVLAVPEIITNEESQKTDIAGILDFCFEDCVPACIAISIVRDASAVKLIADKLSSNEHNAVISELSLISRDGEVLVSAETYEAVIESLLPQVQFISINSFEAELLSQMPCKNSDDLEKAGKAIFAKYSCIVFINSSTKSQGSDLLVIGGNPIWMPAVTVPGFDEAKIAEAHKSRSLLAAIACELSLDKSIIDAVADARKFYAGQPASNRDVSDNSDSDVHRTSEGVTDDAKQPEESVADTTATPNPTITVKSLVSPAKSIRDIAPKKVVGAAPAVTSIIEEPAPGPKGMVSELKERELRKDNQSISELQALKDRLKKISEM